MGKGIGANHGLVRLHHETGGLADHAAGRQYVMGIDAEVQPEIVAPGLDGHHDLFQAAIAGPLAQTVDRALDLARAADLDAGERIGDSHAQIVVAVDRPDGLVGIGDPFTQSLDELAIQLGNRISHRVRDVQGRRPLLDRGFEHPAQEVDITAIPVLRAELDIGDEVAGKAHRQPGLLEHLVRSHAQFLLHVQRRGCDEGVDPRPGGALEGFGSP